MESFNNIIDSNNMTFLAKSSNSKKYIVRFENEKLIETEIFVDKELKDYDMTLEKAI